MEHLSQSWSNVASDGVTSSLLASVGTGLGAMPVMFTSQLSERWKSILLSVGSGIMLSAAAFSLLMPAITLMEQTLEANWWVQAMVIAISTATGALLFYGLEKLLPEPALEQNAQSRSIWLFVLAIALHHFPEGLAVGIGTETTHDASIAIGVALQNLPEGLMVALALRQLGYGVPVALALATVSGWLEPLGGFVGVALADVGTTIAPVGMALAAGAMLFVVIHGLLPELDFRQFNGQGPVGVMTGVVMMGMVQQFLG
ncbi:MAG: ZIP family metal transporter [Cyanobacteria bacterium P01_D01_bin.56]